MVGVKVASKWEGDKVAKKIDDATYKSISHAAASIRLIAKRSIKRRKGKSAEGSPPNTHTSALPRSIIFYADRQRMYAIIGPSSSLIGEAGSAHELGGTYKRNKYPKRSFMVPALEQATPRLPQDWANSFRS